MTNSLSLRSIIFAPFSSVVFGDLSSLWARGLFTALSGAPVKSLRLDDVAPWSSDNIEAPRQALQELIDAGYLIEGNQEISGFVGQLVPTEM